MEDAYKRELLPDTRTCYRYLQTGFGIIGVTALVAVIVATFGWFRDPFEVLVMPALFLGLGLLLLGVGTHLHVMHLNVLEMRDGEG